MFGKNITLFRVFGFEVRMDASWLILAALVIWSLAVGYFPYRFEGLSTATYWIMAVAGALGLLFSIVAHELSHSLVARAYGLPMRGITLFVFGGVAHMSEEPKSPKVELLMALAGPACSLVLAALFLWLAQIAENLVAGVATAGLLRYLALLNGLLAVFNMIPAFPLDGGRVLRALLWQVKGNIRSATFTASRIGAGFGVFLMALGLLSLLTGNLVPGIWWLLIGLFVRGAALASYQQLVTLEALQGQPVSAFMSPDPVCVTPRLTVQALIDDYFFAYPFDAFPVCEDDQVTGLVSSNDARQVPAAERPHTQVAQIMSPLDPDNTAQADEAASRVLARLQKSGNSRVLVLRDNQLVGIMVLKDLLKMLQLRTQLSTSA